MRQRKILGLLIGAGLLLGIALAQQQEVSLRLRYSPGQTLVYKVTVDGKLNLVSEIGVATDFKFKGELRQEQVVQELTQDGKAVVLVTVTGKMEVPNPAEGGQTSSQPVPPTKALLTFSPEGQVLEIKRVRDEKQAPESPMNMQLDPFQALTVGIGAMSLLPPPLPPNPLKVGETWDLSGTKPVPLPTGQSVPTKVVGQGKLLAVERKEDKDFAITEIQTEIPELGDLIAKMVPLQEMGLEVQAKGTTKTTSKNWYDLAQGLLTRSEVTTETKISMTLTMPANVGGGVMSVQSSTQVQAKVELVEVKSK